MHLLSIKKEQHNTAHFLSFTLSYISKPLCSQRRGEEAVPIKLVNFWQISSRPYPSPSLRGSAHSAANKYHENHIAFPRFLEQNMCKFEDTTTDIWTRFYETARGANRMVIAGRPAPRGNGD